MVSSSNLYFIFHILNIIFLKCFLSPHIFTLNYYLCISFIFLVYGAFTIIRKRLTYVLLFSFVIFCCEIILYFLKIRFMNSQLYDCFFMAL